MRRTPRAHYVRHNAVTRVPRAFVYLDTETYRERFGTHEVQSWRLAVAAFDTRRHDSDGWKERDWYWATDPKELWTWIASKCRRKARTVLVAHNLAFDLRISEAFVVLPALGWRCVFVRLDGGQAMAIWRLDDRTLSMVDTMSWVPRGLEHLGELVGLGKSPLPGETDDQETWFERCVRDVEILADVWLRLMQWIQDDDLGNWKPTGAGQSWAAFRHRFKTHDLLVHEDDDARAAERSSVMAGRTEAWRWGKLSGGPFVEWDFEAAYCTIGAECEVPTHLAGELVGATLDRVLDLARTHAVLCEVEVQCETPVVPTRTESGIMWPCGRFTTVVWENELKLALDAGARAHVQRAFVYRRAPALQAFCRWVLDGINERTGHPDPIIRLALKHWSRTLIGRTAAQWPRWSAYGTAPDVRVTVGPAFDRDAGESFRLLQVGRDLYRSSEVLENPDAMVAVMAWVMAEARVRLWKAMETAGLDNVCYVDTDSVIVDAEGDRRLAEARVPGLRVKGVYDSLEVLGPRQIIPGGELRAAGVPRGSRRVGVRTWEGEVWNGLASSFAEGEPELVRVALRRFRLQGTDRRRVHVRGGTTRAVTVTKPLVGD